MREGAGCSNVVLALSDLQISLLLQHQQEMHLQLGLSL